ncbi:MAG: hypothetical protein IH937_12360 [Acidobacteria bacterium]|nr:hypothetical protein [Acidobacteriota bacterium]
MAFVIFSACGNRILAALNVSIKRLSLSGDEIDLNKDFWVMTLLLSVSASFCPLLVFPGLRRVTSLSASLFLFRDEKSQQPAH